MWVPLISPLLWGRESVCMRSEKGRGAEIDSSDEWEAWKIRLYKGFWNVRVSTVLGTFEAHSMTNYIISRLSKFLQTKMDRKKSKVFGKWGRGFLFKPAVKFCFVWCDDGGGRTRGWDGLERRFYLHTPQLGRGGGSGCWVRMQIGLPRLANQESAEGIWVPTPVGCVSTCLVFWDLCPTKSHEVGTPCSLFLVRSAWIFSPPHPPRESCLLLIPPQIPSRASQGKSLQHWAPEPCAELGTPGYWEQPLAVPRGCRRRATARTPRRSCLRGAVLRLSGGSTARLAPAGSLLNFGSILWGSGNSRNVQNAENRLIT